MAIIRKKELKTMGPKELQAKLGELRRELLSARAKMASTKIADNPGKFKQIRKTIARIMTIAGEKGVKTE